MCGPDARRPELAGRWRPTGQTTSGSSRNQIRATEDVLRVSDWVSGYAAAPTVLEGVRADRFEVTYLADGDSQWHKTYLAFNTKFTNNFDAFRTAIGSGDEFWKIYGTKTVVSSTSGPGSNPWSTDKKWIRVTNDGTTVTAKAIVSGTEPTETDWTNTSAMRSTTNLDADGGLIGFGSDGGHDRYPPGHDQDRPRRQRQLRDDRVRGRLYSRWRRLPRRRPRARR